MQPINLTRFAWLSIGAALLNMGLKALAYWLSGSVGLLADAAESSVNLVAAIVALVVLGIVARPPDAEHAYGHDKAEYFSSGAEGGMILLAALLIMYQASRRLLHPQGVEQPGIALIALVLASLLNFGIARILRHAGRSYHSVTLQANAQHLMADLWTSAGVLIGIGAVILTGWVILDPLIALLVAANILRSGLRLVRQALLGLLDTALPDEDLTRLHAILDRYRENGIEYHALLTRQSGARRFVSVHVLVPGGWTVQRGHDLLEQLEADIRAALPQTNVLTHLEPVADPNSWQDIELDRPAEPSESVSADPDPAARSRSDVAVP